jgi:hypothetical protein
MNNLYNDILTAKIPINFIESYEKEPPYFFVKWITDNKRYRISTSFKYLNIKYNLHINIIRDFEKSLDIKKFLYIFKKFKLQEKISLYNDLYYYTIIDRENSTQIFYVERLWNNEINGTIVFFSEEFWSLNKYLDNLMGRINDGSN